MTAFSAISRRARDKYHNLDDDMMVKNILNSGKHKDGVVMKIPSWMIFDEMKLTKNYRMYAAMFGKSHDNLKAKKNVQKVEEHLIAEEIEKLVEGAENVENVEVEITSEVLPVNINEEEEESAKDDYELKRREKGKHVEDSRSTSSPTKIRSLRTHSTLISSDTEKLQELMPGCFKQYRSFFDEFPGRYGYLSENLKTRFMPRKKFNVLAQHLKEIMKDSLTTMVDDRVDSSVRNYIDNSQLQQDDLPIWLALKYKFERLYVSDTPCRPSTVFSRDQDDPHDDALPEGENSAKRQKTSKHGTFVFGESSSGQEYKCEPDPSTSAKLCKVVDEMLRQQCSSGDEHQYHIDQMQNFLKNDIIWKSRKEILVLPHPQKPTLVVQSCQRDPKAPALSLVNQDLLYLKKGNSSLEKIMLSLHKFPTVIFPGDDIEERTSRWTYWELGHEHKFITEIVARRANDSIVSIIESDYKNLNKNDIKDMYLLIINNKVDDYAETGLLWSLSVFIRCIEKYKVFSIVSEPVYGIIDKNNKKEKRVMRHHEVHKFCDATLKRVLEGLNSFKNDVKHGYVTPSLSNEDVEYLQLFEEEIEEWLKYRDQMRHWEMYVNGRPLGSIKEHPK
ncbi:hypothetical protein Tco_1389570 [Tanacetum coccineum]